MRLAGVIISTLLVVLSACAAEQSSTDDDDGAATDDFAVTSSLIADGAALPSSLKCTRDGGTGQSPPLAWSNVPTGTGNFALTMHHYPEGSTPSGGSPNHYWLLWNIASTVSSLDQGNSESIGTEGSNKDGNGTGYTPPCSPPSTSTALHTYVITVHALSAAPTLGSVDTVEIGWSELTTAIESLTIDTAVLSFTN